MVSATYTLEDTYHHSGCGAHLNLHAHLLYYDGCGAYLGLTCLHPPAWERRRRRREQRRALLRVCGADGDEVEGALAEEEREVRIHLACRPARGAEAEHV